MQTYKVEITITAENESTIREVESGRLRELLVLALDGFKNIGVRITKNGQSHELSF